MPEPYANQSAILPVHIARGPLRAGWMEVRIAGLPPCQADDWTLRVVPAGEAVHPIDFALNPGADGSLRQVLYAPVTVARAEMIARCGPPPAASIELRSLGRLDLLRRALAVDPRETRTAFGWRIAGKAVRARNMLMRLLGQPRRMSYAGWLARHAQQWAEEDAELYAQFPKAASMPSIGVVIAAAAGGPAPADALAYLHGQLLPAAFARVAARSSEISDLPDWDWLLVLPGRHRLAPSALLHVAAAALAEPAPAAIYWDTDRQAADRTRYAPQLKPEWNEALQLACDYVGPFAVSRAALARGPAGLPGELWESLLLRAVGSKAGPVTHIKRVLSTEGDTADVSRSEVAAFRRDLVEAYVNLEDPAAKAGTSAAGPMRVTFPLPSPPPLVTLIVPTRDRIDLLKPCVEGLLSKTSYPDLEVLIADNGSRDPATLAWMKLQSADSRVRIVDCAGPFNFASINNRAAAAASGTVLGFINNDVEVIVRDWLTTMVAQALRPGIGAVGARLLYASGVVQHAGVILGVGGFAGHAHRFARPTDWGYLGRLQAEQYVAAVTAACLVVERHKFEAVGGFDAEAFPVAYNDVDLCLRLRSAGWQTLWTPFAELLHKESASRARDYSPDRRAAYERECHALLGRWRSLIDNDPHYHPALSRSQENFSLD